MFLFTDQKKFASVWRIKPKSDKVLELEMSTSEKAKEGEGYINSHWYPIAVGRAYNVLKDVKVPEGGRVRIIVKSIKFSTERYEDKEGNKKTAYRVCIIDCELEDKPSGETTARQPEAAPVAKPATTDDTGDCPW